uniref:Ig-like domain-containing protein n=1 Tax=Cyprinus carpio carpio TaxID=630221 RepID=A0A8C1F1R1_CYPCA
HVSIPSALQSKLFYVYVLLCAPHSLVVCVVCSPVIQQSPKHLLRRVEEKEANLSCRHGDSSYQYLYWYQQKSNGGSLELIGMLSFGEPSPEDKFKTRFKITGHATQDAFLLISNISAEDSAVYFCAASEHSSYFGNGTKLTVLERDVKEPEVEILKPSGIETRCKKTITLVCVAEKFYPDHVSITWTLGDKEIKENVATDPYATQDKTTKLFSMTSRLKVSKKEFKPKNKYRCTVNFYNGTHDISDNTDEINGIEGISLDIN